MTMSKVNFRKLTKVNFSHGSWTVMCVCVCVCAAGGPAVRSATKRTLDRENVAPGPTIGPTNALQPSSAKKSAFSAATAHVTAFKMNLLVLVKLVMRSAVT